MNQAGSNKPVRHPRTASRSFAGEVVIVDTIANRVRMLNSVGSRIWELADGTRSVDEIAAMLAREFEVDLAHARHSVDTFLDELAQKELLVWE